MAAAYVAGEAFISQTILLAAVGILMTTYSAGEFNTDQVRLSTYAEHSLAEHRRLEHGSVEMGYPPLNPMDAVWGVFDLSHHLPWTFRCLLEDQKLELGAV